HHSHGERGNPACEDILLSAHAQVDPIAVLGKTVIITEIRLLPVCPSLLETAFARRDFRAHRYPSAKPAALARTQLSVNSCGKSFMRLQTDERPSLSTQGANRAFAVSNISSREQEFAARTLEPFDKEIQHHACCKHSHHRLGQNASGRSFAVSADRRTLGFLE